MLTRKFDNPVFIGELEFNDRQFTVRYKVMEKPVGETVEKTFRHKDREGARRRYEMVVGWMERAATNRKGLMAFGIDVLRDDPNVVRPGRKSVSAKPRAQVRRKPKTREDDIPF